VTQFMFNNQNKAVTKLVFSLRKLDIDTYGPYFDDFFSLCAGLWSAPEGKCLGDFGGPLVCYDDDRNLHLSGLVSWGLSCETVEKPGVYTRVSRYISWIKSTIEEYRSLAPDEIEDRVKIMQAESRLLSNLYNSYDFQTTTESTTITSPPKTTLFQDRDKTGFQFKYLKSVNGIFHGDLISLIIDTYC